MGYLRFCSLCSGGHFGFLLIQKIAQGCQSGIRLILAQDMLEHQNQQKELVLPQVHG